ncbi:hypothetical protein QQX98_005897 [Neonectria punicea]|uniref:Heterokaryon incompatibility domain-containing protein n=1 Tax=Neonectria punicea TaxID=979145 RepID=A0ABR1H332_9HYPO
MGGFGRHYNNWEREDLEPSKRLTEEGSYLLRRGWVLQETLLPRRVLHFLPDEATWRCPSASRCECNLRPHDKVAHVPLDLEEPREINTKDLKKFWKEIVEQYTRRQLTFPSDRLVAVTGVASRAHSVSPNVDYYAGLWSDALPSTLLWVVYRAVELERHSLYASDRIKPCIAPTWSWASITGHATFLFWQRNYGRGKFANSPPDLTDICISCTPSGQNKYGNVSDARLTAVGYLCKVHVWLVRGSRWHYPFKMEAQERDGKVAKSQGLVYPDIDEFLESLQATGERGTILTVVSVYESRIFLVLREISKKDWVFERVAVLWCEERDAVVLPEWGDSQRFTLV